MQVTTPETQNLPFYPETLGKQVKEHIKNLHQSSSYSEALYGTGNLNTNSFNSMEFTVIWWSGYVPCSEDELIESIALVSQREGLSVS